MEFDVNSPIYLQIMNQIKSEIINGQLKQGQKMQSVRQMAMDLKTNPNTIQRALSELERENILFSKRGLGRFVTESLEKIQEIKREEIQLEILSFFQTMEKFGITKKEVVQLIERYLTEMGGKEEDE